VITIDDIGAPRPLVDDLAGRYRALEETLAAAPGGDAAGQAVRDWDALRRQTATWSNLVSLRFSQDTANAAYRSEREYRDELAPRLTDLDARIKRQLLMHAHRPELERVFGRHAFALWETDVLSFDPAIQEPLAREAKLGARYDEQIAGAKLAFRGATHNFSGIVRFREHADRKLRHEAETTLWQWFAEHRSEIDGLYDDLVRLRHEMARTLGYDDYVVLGYRRMRRTDYGPAEVERFRGEVRAHLVPFAAELRRRQAAALRLERLMFWDEQVHDPRGNPVPLGGHDWMLGRASELFDAMGSELGSFFRLMRDGRLMDLRNRPAKRFGGFCISFPTHGVPYIFASFNGTTHDAKVFTHEMGHAYQSYRARGKALADYLSPTLEAAEIDSMGLEMLTAPQMEKFFGEDAERYRRIHLVQALSFIPYGVAVDHFQHLVYAQPHATPAQRNAMWQEMERSYLPWRDYGDLPHVVDGGAWQFQRHIYARPFYYIDYALAQTCALQFWLRAREDRDEAMAAYHALCTRGGEAPFLELVRSAGLTSPFEAGCLAGVVAQARRALG
jgi:M3 family oligoendopeptidase